MRRRAVLRTGALGLTTTIAGCAGSDGGDRSSDEPTGPPRLAVDGRWLTDPEGNRVVLRGVNLVDPWWGTEHAALREKGYWETLSLTLDRDAGWHTHAVRIPVQPETVAAVGLEAVATEYLDPAVDRIREAGAYAIVDYHAIERYDTAAIDRRVREFWSTIAPRYADDPHVLYELFNEPSAPRGAGLDTWKHWREVATPWVDLVREHAPNTPIIVGSPRWTSMTRHAATAPFDDGNLLYAAHVYPSWGPETWEPNFGAPAREVPVFVTEWGYIDVDNQHTDEHMLGSTSGFGEPFREWFDGHANVHWTAWCFDSVWMPRMFDQEWTLLGGEDHMGQFTKDWLADKANDHWPYGDGA